MQVFSFTFDEQRSPLKYMAIQIKSGSDKHEHQYAGGMDWQYGTTARSRGTLRTCTRSSELASG